MRFGRKPARPVDRALADLEEKIAAKEREIRRAQLHPPAPPPARAGERPPPVAAASRPTAWLGSVTSFVRQVITADGRAATPVARTRRDLFDIPTDPLRELDESRDAGPLGANTTTAGRDRRDGAATMTAPPPGPAASRAGVADERLVRYLSAGTLRGPKPLKHVQRRERHRFAMWLGLAFVVLWILYVIVR